ncbi:MAG TPA: carboxypeptidase-like regulatory domain-containing protein, partial [Chitinophagaceae bacterium]|nr:carboxypeptidase-like regulatory domain-containing protein [Chitinophagaceae bacterium]
MKSKCLRLCLLALFSLVVSLTFAQPKRVTGKVLSDDSRPLSGVSVVIKGKPGGTQTNTNGEYSIEASVGDILVFSYSGFSTREMKVGSSPVIDLSLETKVSELDAVVVTGYGTQKRKEVTGAVTTVNPKVFEHSPSSNVATVLQGNTPG